MPKRKALEVDVRRGELASKTWLFDGEGGVGAVGGQKGDVILRLSVRDTEAVRHEAACGICHGSLDGRRAAPLF